MILPSTMTENLLNIREGTRVCNLEQLEELLGIALKGEKRGNIQVLAALTNFPNVSALRTSLKDRGFEVIAEHGDLLLVKKRGEVPFYTLLDSDSTAVFITRARKTEDIPGTVLSYINSTKDAALIRIGNRRMLKLMAQLSRKHPGLTLPFFTAHRESHTPIPSAYRSEQERTIIYSGADGLDTLEEMEFHYGIVPRIMEFHLSEGGRFRVDLKGILTIIDGGAGVIFWMLNEVISDIMRLILPFRKEGAGPFPRSRLTVRAVEGWTSAGMKKMEHALTSEWGLSIFSSVIKPQRGVYYSRVVDVEEGTSWDVFISGERLMLVPLEGQGMKALLKILEVMEDHLSLQLPHNEEVRE